jgi:CubicO group peptidase (beta-lactamase class C family)
LLAVILLSPCAAAQDPWPTKKWPTAMPTDVGLNFAALAEFDADIAKGKYTHVDTVTVIRHGKIAFDRSYPRDYAKIYGDRARKSSPIIVHDRTGPFNPFNSWWHPYYRRGDLHTLQSVTKAVVSVVVGVAIARGDFPKDLDTPVMKFFNAQQVANLDDRKRQMTIRHLLTMTSGVEWKWTSTPNSDGGTDTDTAFGRATTG